MGTVTVTGSSSTLALDNSLSVGQQSGGANALTISAGGTVTVAGNNGGGLGIAQGTGSQGPWRSMAGHSPSPAKTAKSVSATAATAR